MSRRRELELLLLTAVAAVPLYFTYTVGIVPLLLFMLGISGAWIGNLAALEPYQPYFLAAAAAFLGIGYYLVYRRPKAACDDGQACARPLPNRIEHLDRRPGHHAGKVPPPPGTVPRPWSCARAG